MCRHWKPGKDFEFPEIVKQNVESKVTKQSKWLQKYSWLVLLVAVTAPIITLLDISLESFDNRYQIYDSRKLDL